MKYYTLDQLKRSVNKLAAKSRDNHSIADALEDMGIDKNIWLGDCPIGLNILDTIVDFADQQNLEEDVKNHFLFIAGMQYGRTLVQEAPNVGRDMGNA